MHLMKKSKPLKIPSGAKIDCLIQQFISFSPIHGLLNLHRFASDQMYMYVISC